MVTDSTHVRRSGSAGEAKKCRVLLLLPQTHHGPVTYPLQLLAESPKIYKQPHVCVALGEDSHTHGVTHASPAYVGSASDCAWRGTRRSLELAGYFRLDAILPSPRRVEQR